MCRQVDPCRQHWWKMSATPTKSTTKCGEDNKDVKDFIFSSLYFMLFLAYICCHLVL